MGEFSLPFLLATGVQFIQRNELYSSYKMVCRNLMTKSRLRGVRLILPVDLVVGDEVISSDQLMKCYTVYDKDSRDEGGDYDGDSTVITCDPEVQNSPITGYPLDIGPMTCQILRTTIPQHHLHLSWGTAGCCEISSFQTGQRALVESSLHQTTSKTPSAPLPVVPQMRNILLGEANVEWWSRICDPEGEFEGDIVKKGIADFTCRHPLTFTSVISQLPSTHISNILRRAPELNEWDYLTAHRKVEDPDDEEEEEEEEDDE
jgi:hypothetical protein